MRWFFVTELGPDLRVRFCPSPTGNPHVGMVRTALFNWAFARHHGGTFVFRIEDTDSVRDSEESYRDLLEAMRWLGLDWDEGPEVGGDFGPYRQSERREIYAEVAVQLQEAGFAYPCYCTPEELEDRREQARRENRAPGYDGHCRDLTDQQRAALADEGRPAALRFRMPAGTIGWHDLVRGELEFDTEHIPDYVIVRANGDPLYPLVNPVDDAMMRITHVLRGEDLLSSTPRQIAMYDALLELGIATGSRPEFGHLPYVMGEGNRKLSKRDAESSLNMYREQGYLPEGLLNYLALLGWSLPRGWPLPADRTTPPGVNLDDDPEQRERDVFDRAELVAAFDLSRVNPNPARFDLKKCTAINADHIRWLPAPELEQRLLPYLHADGLVSDPATDAERELVAAIVPLIQERMDTLTQASGMVRFLFAPDSEFTVDPTDAAKLLGESGQPVVAAALEVLEPLSEWTTAAIEDALRQRLLTDLQLKPRVAFGPLRVAVTGRRVSPPLFESMELLGRERTLARLRAAQTGD